MLEDTHIEKRLKSLEDHLTQEKTKENDILVKVVHSFRELDKVAYQLGILDQEQSYTTRVSWWPVISILGTFSAGKSTFINYQLGHKVQRTGNQAVDDKFTVICFSGEENISTLPGVALDADPRFPFFQISRAIQDISSGGVGRRIDTYLQLKTCPSEQLRGHILIDSPGFDADSQRTSILRITQHIIDLSDLVLVFFDARHPEPGVMHDTLEYLVSATIDRPDSNKFLFILNQIDVTAREDNPEEVVAAWQRSLAQAGLTTGRFYRIYNPEVAMPIADPKVKERYESKRDADMAEINTRIKQVGVERAYRIVGVLEESAKNIEYRVVPQLRELLQRWKSRVFWLDSIVLFLLLGIVGIGFEVTVQAPNLTPHEPLTFTILAALLTIIGGFLHTRFAKFAAKSIISSLEEDIRDEQMREGLTRAFRKNTTLLRSLLLPFIEEPAGWSETLRKRISKILSDANIYVQALNDRFTNPSGLPQTTEAAKAAEETQKILPK